jgi:hypothetical protein
MLNFNSIGSMKLRITLKTSLGLAVLALSCIPQSATAQGNLVFNGGFDYDASGWIATNIAGGAGYDPLKGHPGGCFTLWSGPSSSLTPIISQPINGLVSGSSYLVSGDYSVAGGTLGSTPSFGVAMDGIYLFEVAPTIGTWQSFSFSYTATDSSALLSLAAELNGTHVAYRVDNIFMEGVPEPNSLWLLGVGAITSALLSHPRRVLIGKAPSRQRGGSK